MLSKNVKEFLLCPNCKVGNLVFQQNTITCARCNAAFPVVQDRPVLLRHDNALFKIADYTNQSVDKKSSSKAIGSYIPSPSINLSRFRVLTKLGKQLKELNRNPVVLVVGGGSQRKSVDEILGSGGAISIVYTDIDTQADVDLFCDAHDLPFQDQVFDAVITTAVLEHVVSPQKVAFEITRVLRNGGYIYSELPFMQQVHEGAYDFSRFSLTGHRLLFNNFEEIESGMVAGPGTALVWAIENYLLSFTSNRMIRNVLRLFSRLFFSWLKYTDIYLAKNYQAMDAASCTYLYGNKITIPIEVCSIIDAYVGAKDIQHT